MRPFKLKTDRYRYLQAAESNVSSRSENNRVEEWWPHDRHSWEQLEAMQDDETISSYISEQLTNNEDNDEEMISQLLAYISQGSVPHSHCQAENLQRIAPIVQMVEETDGTRPHLEVNFTPSSQQPLSILGVAERLDGGDNESERDEDDFEDDCSDHERRTCGGIFCIASPSVLVSSRKMLHNLSSRSRQLSRTGRCSTTSASQPLLSKQKSSSVIHL